MNKLIIWGAGKYGDLAYKYYKSLYENISYVDSNPSKWNDRLNSISICDPDEVDFTGADIVIASKYNVNTIIESIKNRGVNGRISVFNLNIENVQLDSADEHVCGIKKLYSIGFSGGLGNQLFQYAFFLNISGNGQNAFANIDRCKLLGGRGFLLNKVFPSINMKLITTEEEGDYLRNLFDNRLTEKFLIYNENFERNTKKCACPDIINSDGGIYRGLFQSSYWPDRIKKKLLEDLVFEVSHNESLKRFIDRVVNDQNSVSIHFRRGDYLNDLSKFSYGGICTQEYYDSAIQYVLKKVKNATFYVFSDDKEFIRTKVNIPNAIYVLDDMFDEYEDWYDMCLMSKCKHNIIANSTFSWWGAWLNTNESKIVICPQKWTNTFEYMDIYPKSWIRL